MDIHELSEYLDGYLRTAEVPDYATALNGLQVQNSGRVTKIAGAVDASVASISAAIERGCDVLLVVGTSAVVHPAASLIPIAKRRREVPAKVIEVNLTRTEPSAFPDAGLYGPSGEMLPKLVERLNS